MRLVRFALDRLTSRASRRYRRESEPDRVPRRAHSRAGIMARLATAPCSGCSGRSPSMSSSASGSDPDRCAEARLDWLADDPLLRKATPPTGGAEPAASVSARDRATLVAGSTIALFGSGVGLIVAGPNSQLFHVPSTPPASSCSWSPRRHACTLLSRTLPKLRQFRVRRLDARPRAEGTRSAVGSWPPSLVLGGAFLVRHWRHSVRGRRRDAPPFRQLVARDYLPTCRQADRDQDDDQTGNAKSAEPSRVESQFTAISSPFCEPYERDGGTSIPNAWPVDADKRSRRWAGEVDDAGPQLVLSLPPRTVVAGGEAQVEGTRAPRPGSGRRNRLERFDPVSNERKRISSESSLLILTVVRVRDSPAFSDTGSCRCTCSSGFVLTPPIVLKLAKHRLAIRRYYLSTSAYVSQRPRLPITASRPIPQSPLIVLFTERCRDGGSPRAAPEHRPAATRARFRYLARPGRHPRARLRAARNDQRRRGCNRSTTRGSRRQSTCLPACNGDPRGCGYRYRDRARPAPLGQHCTETYLVLLHSFDVACTQQLGRSTRRTTASASRASQHARGGISRQSTGI